MVPHLYLSIQSSYQYLQLALFAQEHCLDELVLQGARASSQLIFHMQTMLAKNGKTLADLDFIAIDAGPGAFTSLRVGIATVNGIAFGCKIPVVGVNGLEALFLDGLRLVGAQQNVVGVLGLLNAYNRDAYFCVGSVNKPNDVLMGCKKIQEVLADSLRLFPTGNLGVLGNGVSAFEEELKETFSDRVIVLEPLQEVPSVRQIASLGYKLWLAQQEKSFRIAPNYLKSQLFAVQKT